MISQAKPMSGCCCTVKAGGVALRVFVVFPTTFTAPNLVPHRMMADLRRVCLMQHHFAVS
jgi:hypothetical protein